MTPHQRMKAFCRFVMVELGILFVIEAAVTWLPKHVYPWVMTGFQVCIYKKNKNNTYLLFENTSPER